MKRPQPTTLWRLTWLLVAFALTDVALTSVGVLFFGGEEGNPLIVALADLIAVGDFDERVVLAVWISKLSVMLGVLLAAHVAVKSRPARDDWVIFLGLIISLVVYVGVIGSWIWFFALAARRPLGTGV